MHNFKTKKFANFYLTLTFTDLVLNFFLFYGTILSARTYAPVAQLDRVSDSDSEGRAFESHRAYQKKDIFRIRKMSFFS